MNAGCPVADNQNVMTAGPRGPMLLLDVWYLERIAHFDREVIPERRMHAKGSGGTATKATILSGLLIVAIADNLTDSLSIHIYQESERLEPRRAFHATLTNFSERLGLSLSFVFLMVILPLRVAVVASILWGLLLLTGLSYVVARTQKLPVLREIAKHVAVAAVVMFSSKMIGHIFSA